MLVKRFPDCLIIFIQVQTAPAPDKAPVKHKTAKRRCSGRSGQRTSKTFKCISIVYNSKNCYQSSNILGKGIWRGENGSPSTMNNNFRKHRYDGRRACKKSLYATQKFALRGNLATGERFSSFLIGQSSPFRRAEKRLFC